MAQIKVAVLGLGRLGSVLARQLIEAGYAIHAADPNPEPFQSWGQLPQVRVFSDSAEAVRGVDLVIIAVKPQSVLALADQISDDLSEETVMLSMATGVSLARLSAIWPNRHVLRGMPNLACGVGASLTAVVGVVPEEVMAVLKVFGEVMMLPEEQMHLFTGAVGSGPAFLCRVLRETADRLAASYPELSSDELQSWLLSMTFGTAKVLQSQDQSMEALESSVSAPNGTTIAGLEAGAESDAFDLSKAIMAAASRSEAIAGEVDSAFD